MIYLDNTTDTQEIFIPRKAVEPEYSPMNRPLEVFIDDVKVQDNVMTYLRTVEPQSKDEGYSTVTVSMNVPMTYQNLTDNGVFQFNEPVGTVEVNVDTDAAYNDGYEQGYNEGHNVGYNERDNIRLQPTNVADIIAIGNGLEVGEKTIRNYFLKGTISRITSIDLDYGNARYWVTDSSGEEIQVYRGRYYWGMNFLTENDIQVGQTVYLVCAVQNYKGTPQIPANSYLIYTGD